jgi:KDO2-lipid IV(A) lauroyltransferase
VALPHGDPATDRLFSRQRQRCGLEVIPLGKEAGRRSLRSLQEGRLLGLLGDREFGGEGLEVRFGAGTLTVPRGPALLSLRSRAPIVPAFFIRESPWTFRLVVEPAILPDGEDTGPDAVDTLTRRCAAAVERMVLRHPDQWLMFEPVLG